MMYPDVLSKSGEQLPYFRTSEFSEKLRNGYDITVTPSGGGLRGTLLRAGNIGNLSENDYDALLGALKKVLNR